MTSSLLLVLLSCAPKPAPAPVEVPQAPPPAPLPDYARSMLDAMDTTVSPCDDFYRYACGNWLKTTPLPSDKPAWTRSFSQISDNNLATMREVLDDTTKAPGTDPDRARLAAYYGSCMDEAGANAAGLTPLQPLLAEIDGVKDVPSFMRMAGKLATLQIAGPIGWDIDSDFKNPDMADLFLYQGGLSLPDRDYYLKSDDASKKVIAGLQDRVAAVLVSVGYSTADAAKLAPAVVAFETALAQASVPKAELRDAEKIFNKVDAAGLKKLAPKLAFDAWMTAAGVGGAQDIVATTPAVFTKFQDVVLKTDVKTLKAYQKWQTVHALASSLDNATYQADFDFFGRQVLGQKEPEVRWKRCVRSTNGALGEALGRVWVDKQFPGDSKTVAVSMLQRIEGAFEAGLPSLAWMDDTTRTRAKEKAVAVTNKIGFPDAWRDYSKLQVSPGAYAGNVVAARAFESARLLSKVGHPVDKKEWFMTPPTVNAYYNATWNEMVFPAGILQPPFFRHDYPAAMNFGGIGMVMGHELTHGFDDEGRKFDGSGKLVAWWAPEVSARFEERAACVKDQYDGYAVGGDLHVNGALTLGENIADLGGTRLAYRAWSAAPGDKANVPGLTDAQVFFLSFAQGWCTVASPEYEKMLVLSNPHSPAEFRVNGPLTNLPEFHEAFGCNAGTKMHPAKTCEVW